MMLTHAWGQSWQLFHGASVCLWRFEGKAGGVSSYHVHEHKVNVFLVKSGILELTIDGTKRRVYANQSCVVPQGVPHSMAFVTNAEGLELYYATDPLGVVDVKDIIRLEPGMTPDGQEYRQWEA